MLVGEALGHAAQRATTSSCGASTAPSVTIGCGLVIGHVGRNGTRLRRDRRGAGRRLRADDRDRGRERRGSDARAPAGAVGVPGRGRRSWAWGRRRSGCRRTLRGIAGRGGLFAVGSRRRRGCGCGIRLGLRLLVVGLEDRPPRPDRRSSCRRCTARTSRRRAIHWLRTRPMPFRLNLPRSIGSTQPIAHSLR